MTSTSRTTVLCTLVPPDSPEDGNDVVIQWNLELMYPLGTLILTLDDGDVPNSYELTPASFLKLYEAEIKSYDRETNEWSVKRFTKIGSAMMKRRWIEYHKLKLFLAITQEQFIKTYKDDTQLHVYEFEAQLEKLNGNNV